MPTVPPLKHCPAPSLEEIDALFEQAGLVRSPRAVRPGIPTRTRLERAGAKERVRLAPSPRVAPNGVQWLPVPGWEKTPWLWHGFSTRRGGATSAYCADGVPGELNLGFTVDDSRETVLGNRLLLAEAVSGDSATPLITIRQIHSNTLVVAGKTGVPQERPHKADGIMTDEPGLLIGVQTADCIPVLVADLKRRAVAAFHAGWRGTVKRIVESGIGRMRLEYGSRPEDLVAAIGPGIGACCYAVGEEVRSSFDSQFVYAGELFREVDASGPVRDKYPMLFLTNRAPGHALIGPSLHLNLVEANRRQLLAAGLKPRSIKAVGGCTNCQPELFFSHRASQGRAGRMLSVIGLREGRARV